MTDLHVHQPAAQLRKAYTVTMNKAASPRQLVFSGVSTMCNKNRLTLTPVSRASLRLLAKCAVLHAAFTGEQSHACV